MSKPWYDVILNLLKNWILFFNSVSLGKSMGHGVDPLNSTYK